MSADDPSAVKNWYRPTWEMELIISGALIVTLFQIPHMVDSAFTEAIAHVSRGVIFLPTLAYVVSRYIINALIATFLVHFLFRSFWVGILGLERVYPDGIDWKNLPFGPVMMSFYREHVLDLKSLREMADKTASMLFSILFIVLVNFLWLGFFGLCGLPMAAALRALFFDTVPIGQMFLIVLITMFCVVYVPGMIASAFDSRAKKAIQKGKKQPLSDAASGIIQKTYKFSYYASLSFMTIPAVLVFKSHVSKLRMAIVIGAVSVLFPVTLLFNLLLVEDEIGLESYIYFPNEARELGMSATHYDSLRQDGKAFKVPTIQSDFISDPYVRLFLPFHATSDNAIIDELCPDLEAFRADGLVFGEKDNDDDYDADKGRAAMNCLASIFEVQLDGEVLASLEYAFYTHPQTSVRGLLTYIDVRSRDQGKHILTIKKRMSKRQREKRDEDETARKTYTIPFWL